MTRAPSRVRRRIALAILPAAIASAAPAAEWTARGFFSQRFEASGDRGFEGGGVLGNPALDAVTDLGVTIAAATPRLRFVLAPGVRGLFTTAESIDSGNVAPRLTGSAVLTGRRSQTSLSLSLIPSFVTGTSYGDPTFVVIDDVLVEEFDTREEEAVRLSASARLGHSVELTPRDTAQVGLFVQASEYISGDADDLTPTQSYGVNASWSRALTPRTSASLSPSFRQFFSEDDGDDVGDGNGDGNGDDDDSEDARTFSLVAGLQHEVNGRLALNAGLGPSYTITEGSGSGDLGFVGDLGVTYATAQTRYAASLSQRVAQDTDGSVGARLGFGASASRSINRVSSLSLRAGLSLENPLLGGEEDGGGVLTLSPGYNLALSPDWSLSAGYRFSARQDEEDGWQPGNSVFLQLTRGFELLP